jgi:hypothetical protein
MSLDKSFIAKNFVRIPIPGLGDCFYETLRLYGTLYRIPSLQQTVTNLRKTVYDEMIRKRNTNHYQIAMAGLTNADLNRIKEKQQYLNEANIAAVQLAYEVFQVNIIFYHSDRHGFRIDRYPDQINSDRSTIHMLRVDDIHFDLLIPNGDPIQELGIADQIRSVRLSIKQKEIKKNEELARSLENNRYNHSIHKLEDEMIKLRREEQDAINEASDIMRIPDYQMASKEVSNNIYRLTVTAANEKYARQLAEQELIQARIVSNAAFARRIAEEELANASKRRGGRIARNRTRKITKKNRK